MLQIAVSFVADKYIVFNASHLWMYIWWPCYSPHNFIGNSWPMIWVYWTALIFMTHESNANLVHDSWIMSKCISWPMKTLFEALLLNFMALKALNDVFNGKFLTQEIQVPLMKTNPLFSTEISWPQMRPWNFILQDSWVMKRFSWPFQGIFMGFSYVHVS